MSITRSAASWTTRLPWLVAVGFALVPVLFTALASAAAQVTGAADADAALLIAAAAALSAAAGLIVMRVSPPSLRDYGFRAPRDARAVWWFAPPVATIGIILVTAGVHVAAPTLLAYGLLAIAVAVNEEVWFRGVVLAVLRPRGIRTAIIGSSALFGILHLANLLGGESPAIAGMQLAFAVLFGVVAAELAVRTGSLWPAIVWHAAWDFVNFAGGNATTPLALTGIALCCVILLGYAIALWRGLGRPRRITA